jgi:DNA-binding FadR family transcriptional regulator
VSRAVFREAVRLVEHQHVARMRRGPGGGLVVTAPTVDSVIDAVSVYLFYVGAEIDEVYEARLALEETAAELAPVRLDESKFATLRAHAERERDGSVTDHRELHRLVAETTGNPALEFFVELLNRVMLLYFGANTRMAPKTLAASAGAHEAIIDAVLAGNGGLARNRMRKHLLAEAEFLRGRRPSRRRLADLPRAVARSNKRAESVAREILQEVTAAGWPVGQLLGSEAELMERYDVSRAVLREAVRVLEHHQVARMRRGPGGGLFVTAPGVEATTDAVALHVERRGIEPGQLFEVRGAVEMAVLDRVMKHLDADAIAQLEEGLAVEQSVSRAEFAVVGHDMHGVLAHVSGNRVLELLTLVLLRLTRFHTHAPADAPDPLPSQDVTRAHRGIVEAIIAHDLELARHRTRRHLDALSHWVQ